MVRSDAHISESLVGTGSKRRVRVAFGLWGATAVVALVASATLARVAASPEGDRASVLWAVATTFNRDFAANRPSAVYDRFDGPSRTVISRADYVRRHLECPDPPGPATTTGVERATGGYWLVHYSIDGVALTDYWHYVAGRWRFSLVRSNPDAVALYRLSFLAYARALGCVPGA
jgi:hypothetical protein